MTESAKSIALTETDPSIKHFIIDAANYLEKECGATISDVSINNLGTYY